MTIVFNKITSDKQASLQIGCYRNKHSVHIKNHKNNKIIDLYRTIPVNLKRHIVWYNLKDQQGLEVKRTIQV